MVGQYSVADCRGERAVRLPRAPPHGKPATIITIHLPSLILSIPEKKHRINIFVCDFTTNRFLVSFQHLIHVIKQRDSYWLLEMIFVLQRVVFWFVSFDLKTIVAQFEMLKKDRT
jgi:hypothetical protein